MAAGEGRPGLGRDLTGWTAALRDRKIAQLASVIARMNAGAGPDLLGVAEVENRFVLELLTDAVRGLLGRDYAIAHADTRDARGIDVAFLYDPVRLSAPPQEIFFLTVMKRHATREIVQVNFRTAAGWTWAVFGNHWPSRSGGRWESAGYRAIAAETLGYWHERVLEVHGPDTPVLALGGFNDEPFDTSLALHAGSVRQTDRVRNARSALLWNLMWPVMGTGHEASPDGTFYFTNEPNLLDQVLVNRALIDPTGPLRVRPDTVRILRFPGTSSTGDYPKPVPFGGLGKPVDPQGYSDHFPIAVVVEEDQ